MSESFLGFFFNLFVFTVSQEHNEKLFFFLKTFGQYKRNYTDRRTPHYR